MAEQVSIKRRASDVMVSVVRKVDGHTTHWQERVLGPTPETVASAVRVCRAQLDMLDTALKEAG